MVNPLKQYLADNDISQSELARVMGVTRARINQLTIERPQTLRVMMRIEKFTGITPSQWMEWRDGRPRSTASSKTKKRTKRT